MRNGDAAGRDIALRLAEARRADCAAVVVAVVGAIGQIEELGDEFQLGPLTEANRLRNAGVPLEEGSAAKAIERGPDTIAGSQAGLALATVSKAAAAA